MNKVERMSAAPIETWPRSLKNAQMALIYQAIIGLPVMAGAEIAAGCDDDYVMEFIMKNKDLIKEAKQ